MPICLRILCLFQVGFKRILSLYWKYVGWSKWRSCLFIYNQQGHIHFFFQNKKEHIYLSILIRIERICLSVVVANGICHYWTYFSSFHSSWGFKQTGSKGIDPVGPVGYGSKYWTIRQMWVQSMGIVQLFTHTQMTDLWCDLGPLETCWTWASFKNKWRLDLAFRGGMSSCQVDTHLHPSSRVLLLVRPFWRARLEWFERGTPINSCSTLRQSHILISEKYCLREPTAKACGVFLHH